MPECTPPEVIRTNVTSLVLTLKVLGIDNFMKFDLLTPPPLHSVEYALETLFALSAIDQDANVTSHGYTLSEFPTEPRVAKMLLKSLEYNVTEEVMIVAAILQVARNLFLQPRTEQEHIDYDQSMEEVLGDGTGDFISFIEIYKLLKDQKSPDAFRSFFINYLAFRRVSEILKQFKLYIYQYLNYKQGNILNDEEKSKLIRKSILSGFFFQVAKLSSNKLKYISLKSNKPITISPWSVLTRYRSHKIIQKSQYIIYGETHDTSRGHIEVKYCSCIEGRWLREIAPHYWA